jgi:hypothetical protein
MHLDFVLQLNLEDLSFQRLLLWIHKKIEFSKIESIGIGVEVFQQS